MSWKQTLWFVGLWGLTAQAVCVNGHLSVESEFRSSKTVVIAKVIASEKVPASQDGYFLEGTVYHVDVLKHFKGDNSSSLLIFSENSSGRFDMVLDDTYLLFIHEEDGRLSVDNCGNSGSAVKRAATIEQVTKLSHPKAT